MLNVQQRALLVDHNADVSKVPVAVDHRHIDDIVAVPGRGDGRVAQRGQGSCCAHRPAAGEGEEGEEAYGQSLVLGLLLQKT